MLNNILKRLGRAAARYGMYFFYWLFRCFPYWFVKGISKVLIPIIFRLVLRHRKVARESLEIAFGQSKTEKERKQIIKKCFSHAGKNMVELLYYLSHPEQTEGKVSFEGKEHLDNALAKGKGVIAVTAHYGNFPLMMLYCARIGYPCATILRPARDKHLEKFLSKQRDKAKLKAIYAIPRRKCVTQSLQALRNKDILFIPLDQNFGDRGGVYVDFFGQQAATATGPVIYAKRTGAPIILMFIKRISKDHHKIIIEPEFDLEEKEGDEKAVIHNIGRITKIIEQYIKRYPHEWGWMHRRWKSKLSENHKQYLKDKKNE